MEDLRYPIGEFKLRDGISEQDRSALIGQIEETPAMMRAAVAGLTDKQLDDLSRYMSMRKRPNCRKLKVVADSKKVMA